MSGDMRELRHLCGHSQPDFGERVGGAQNRNQSALPDSAPAEHSGWHDEASELLRCVSVHIVLDLVRTVQQCLFTCCHVWTCSCCSRISYYLCVFGLRRQAEVFFFACIVYFRHNIECHAWRRTHMIKVVAVAVPWNNFGHLPVLEATCRLCLEVFKIIQGCIVSIIDVGKQLKRIHVLARKQYVNAEFAVASHAGAKPLWWLACA